MSGNKQALQAARDQLREARIVEANRDIIDQADLAQQRADEAEQELRDLQDRLRMPRDTP